MYIGWVKLKSNEQLTIYFDNPIDDMARLSKDRYWTFRGRKDKLYTIAVDSIDYIDWQEQETN